jgi:hypothetical protein
MPRVLPTIAPESFIHELISNAKGRSPHLHVNISIRLLFFRLRLAVSDICVREFIYRPQNKPSKLLEEISLANPGETMSVVLRETVESNEGSAEILIEADDPPESRTPRYQDYGELRGGKEFVTQSFQKGMDLIRTCAQQVTSAVESLSNTARPSEIEVEFGIKLVGEVGALIAKESAETHLQVTLKWKRADIL